MSATHGHPLAGRFSPAIDRLRTRAAKAGDALWTEGPVQPDHKPLDLCAEALQILVHAERVLAARPEWIVESCRVTIKVRNVPDNQPERP